MASLYIHIPFCERKCFYCSFVVAVGQQQRMDAYLDCLGREAGQYKGRVVETVYIGGGTPTLLNNAQLKQLIGIIKTTFSFSHAAEFTIEANPEGMDLEKGRALADLGINRMSLGVQTFDDRYLKMLGRRHDSAGAVRAFDNLRKAGFKNINLDLMYSFPEQTLSEIEADVKALVNLQAEHVSLYTLTVEPRSKFYAQSVRQQDNRDQAEQYECVAALLAKSGFPQYEVSNFAKPGRESVHNLNYWQTGNTFGLGVGAHSHHEGTRSWNTDRFQDYLKRMQSGSAATTGSETLPPSQRLTESLLIGLRMTAGINLKTLEQKFQTKLPPENQEQINTFITQGLITRTGQHLKATPKGILVLDEMGGYFV